MKKYNLGGILEQILPIASSFVPGGSLISPLLNLIQNKTEPQYYQSPQSTNPFGKELGGPILPMIQESTFVAPRPFLPTLPVQPQVDPNLQVQQLRAANQYNPMTGLGKYDANGKVKSKDRFHEKSHGGYINDGFKSRPYYKNNIIVEGEYDIEDFSDADIQHLKSQGYSFEKLK